MRLVHNHNSVFTGVCDELTKRRGVMDDVGETVYRVDEHGQQAISWVCSVPLGDGVVPTLAVDHANRGGNNKGEVFAAFLLNQAKGFNNDGGFAVAGRHVQQRELSATVTHAVVEFFGQPGCTGVVPVNVFDFVPVVVEFGQVGVVGDSRWFGRFLRLFLGGRGVGA